MTPDALVRSWLAYALPREEVRLVKASRKGTTLALKLRHRVDGAWAPAVYVIDLERDQLLEMSRGKDRSSGRLREILTSLLAEWSLEAADLMSPPEPLTSLMRYGLDAAVSRPTRAEGNDLASWLVRAFIAIASGDRDEFESAFIAMAAHESADARFLLAVEALLGTLPEALDEACRRCVHTAVPALLRARRSGSARHAYERRARPPEGIASRSFAKERVEFERDGVVALRGAIPPARLNAWRRRAATLAEEDGLLSAADANLVATPGARGWPRTVRTVAHANPPIVAFSRDLAALAGELLGGWDRGIATWGDDLLFRGREAIAPGVPHLDETPADGRIDNLRLGLLLLVLVSDVGEDDGPTVFYPGSPPIVAAALAEAPGGQDMDDRRWRMQLMPDAGAPQLATGRAGDVFLLHPLTLHTATTARSDTVRVIANPNIFARGALDYLNPRSPVERYAGVASTP